MLSEVNVYMHIGINVAVACKTSLDFVADFLILGWIGQMVVEYPYVEIGQVATLFYFFYFIIIIPFFGKFESYLLRMDLNK